MAPVSDVDVRKRISSTFKLHGFSLKEDACSFLTQQLCPFEKDTREEWLEKIIDLVQNHSWEAPTIHKTQIEQILQDCAKNVVESAETVLNVISAFEIPRFTYVHERKKFFELTEEEQTAFELFGNADQKSFLFRERYTILLQRTQRHELFSPAVLGSESGCNNKACLFPVEYFLSSSKRIDSGVCLGLLTQLQEGRYYLEDPTGVIQLNLTNARFHSGLHTENCFVLAEGFYEDSVFHVRGIGFPPPELSKTSRVYFGNVNTFGGPSTINLKSSSKLKSYEEANADQMMIFISDVWLDNIKVLEKLTTLFQGYAEIFPIAFVFMGNFLSTQCQVSQTRILKTKLKALADILTGFPELISRSKFIFIPGPSDCTAANILPRPPLPEWVTEDFRERISSAIFTTNPCRIQYCTKEIVVIREDLVTKMCRNTIHFPTTGAIPDHFAKTIVCQAHLAPLPLSVCPVFWSYDSALHLYPVPDLIVTSDQFTPFFVSYMECQVINPGSFVNTDFSFKVYIPAQQIIEDSQIPDE